MTKRLLLLLLTALTLHPRSIAQSTDAYHHLELASGSFQLEPDDDKSLHSNDVALWPTADGMRFGVVGLERFPSKQEQRQLAGLGIHLMDYLPAGFYSVSIRNGVDLSPLNSFGVLAHSGYQPSFKGIAQTTDVPSRAVLEDGRWLVNVAPHEVVALQTLASKLAAQGLELREVNTTFDFITAVVDEEGFDALLELPQVQAVEWVYPAGEPENYTSRSLTRTSYLSAANNNGLNYDGSGVSVAVQDNGAIGPHIDYHGRIEAQFTTQDEGNHGDHVAGTIGGAGNLNPLHEGQASGASLYVYKAYPEYNGISSVDSHYFDHNIYLISTSYSDGCNAGYTSRARTVDAQSYDYERLIHVYSAGNSGTSNCGYGAGSTWGNITGGHKMGKNVVTVANLTDTDQLATSSSRGPAHDGRIKPDIAAQGTSVTSTIEGNQYDTYTGTSMSCPNVAGSLTLLYEVYEDLYGEQPKGGLMKAIVLNTAEDIGNAGPDFKHGWGRLNGRRAYELMEQGNIIVDSVSSGGGLNSHLITVPEGVSRLRVMVYWTDPEASINASTALVNDLDLTGLSPVMDTLYPYVLDPSPNTTTLDAPATPGVDHLNNVEQIEVMDPDAGDYAFSVNPFSVPQGPQEYYLVYWMETEPLTLTYPVGGESFTPFTSERIRWDADVTGTVDIEYSDNGGTSWNSIATGVNVEELSYAWTVPFLQQGDIQLRLTHDSAVVVSDSFSVMAVPTGLSVAWACPDSIGLMWDPTANALSYDVYKLGDKYMDSIGSSTTESFVDYWSNPYSDMLWYSVSSNGPDGAKSKRAVAIQKSPGLVGCFLANDLEAVQILPNISQLFACHGDAIHFNVVVANQGTTPSSGFDLSLIGPGGALLTETFTTSIAPLEQDTFEFSTALSLDSGLNEYMATLSYGLDQNNYNDTARQSYLIAPSSPLLPLWEEHFDGMTNCSTESDCGQTTCPLPDGWINEENGVFDDADWRVNSGATPSQFTGPFGDNTTPSANGRYLYIEASGDCNEKSAHLISPCIDLTDAQDPMLSFYYNMYGSDMGELHVDVFDGEFWVEDVFPPINGNQGATWKLQEIGLSAFNGKMINVRFRGVTGLGFQSDMALDDIMISHPPVANFSYTTQSNGQTVLFADSSIYADSMSFDLGDGSALLDSVPHSHDYMQQIAYTVKQVVTNAFGQDSMVHEIINLNAGAIEDGDVSLYPVPANEVLIIEWDDLTTAEAVELWTVDGRRVLVESGFTTGRLELNTQLLDSGVYLLKLLSDQPKEFSIVVTH